MRSLVCAAVAAAVLFGATSSGQAAPAEDPLVNKVNKAIQSGVDYLRDRGKKGNWEVDAASLTPLTKGGWTGLALLAMLNCGVPADDPDVKRGLEYLRGIDTDATYVLSVQTMVFILAGQDIDKQRIQQNVDLLLKTRLASGWSYSQTTDKKLGRADNSNTQYALLALHEAKQAGYRVDDDALRKIQQFYKDTQANGGWNYVYTKGAANTPTVTMTTAGLCALYMTGMDLNVGLQKLDETTGIAENCGKYDEDPHIARAITWLSNRFPSRLNGQTIQAQQITPIYYALYGIERAGRMSGERYLGDNDWYRIGCEYLVAEQKLDGSWTGAVAPGEKDGWPVISTSFALLFLSKGRTPVLVTKMAYGQPTYNGWNNKHNDARNLTEFASRTLFKRQPMAWQVFDVRNKTADGKGARRDLAAELLQSPLVYFNGHDKVPGDKEREILEEYVENGGVIFAEACCGRDAFRQNFEALMKKMFPNAELVDLPENHPVWTAKFPVVPGRPFHLKGISQGCKTVVIYSPDPITGYWEANQFEKGNGKIAFELGANIVAYATGLEPPKYKGTEVAVFRGDDKTEHKRGYLEVAQLQRNVIKAPIAPNAMRNLMAESRKLGLDVMLETKRINPTSEDGVLSYNFFYMHDREEFSYATADVKALRFKLEDGGTLLADACCGSAKFDESFHKFIDELFDHKLKLEDIPPDKDELLFSAKLNPEKLDSSNIRGRRQGGKPYANMAPALQGVKFEGRWIVIYSKYDLGCALENKPSPDCVGYDHDSAVKLARAAVLYHLNR